MFQGSIPNAMRSIVLEHVKSWPHEKGLWVGCSGNFTIERLVDGIGVRTHSNDVSAYSTALGYWLSERKVPYSIKPEYEEELSWLEPYFETDIDRIASIMLGTTFLPLVGSEKTYQRRLLAAYKNQYPALHAKTVKRMEDLPLKVESFSCMDVREYFQDVVPKDAPVAAFPPFWSNGYEKMFEGIDHYFDWPRPDYPELDEEGKDELLELMTNRANWIVGLHIEHPELEGSGLENYYRGFVKDTNRSVPIHIYSSKGKTRISLPSQKLEFLPVPKIGFSDTIERPLSLIKLTNGQFSALRSQFLSKHIAPGQPDSAYGVVANGKLLGCFAYGSQSGPGKSKDTIYVLSDFPVGWSKYKNLAKLIIMCAMSKEAQTLVQRSLSRKVTKIETTAFTNRPSSMKYRGPLKLKSRKEAKDGYHKYQLQYAGPLGQMTLDDVLEKWLAGPGKTIRENHQK
ncbi:putative antirestriction adenine methyltransferase [Corynebacterium striatum]|nr:hypothetical protein U2A4042170017 [Corynebacterium striatum]